MASVGFCPNSYVSLPVTVFQLQKKFNFFFPSLISSKLRSNLGDASFFTRSAPSDSVTAQDEMSSSTKHNAAPFSGFEDVMMGYMFGQKKATEVAHAVWKKVIRKGDVVIDATCGNGYDTLAMLRLIADNTQRGRVYAMDLQKDAIESTSTLLDRSVTAAERKLVDIYAMCHTKMEELVQPADAVRLVAFNLGYLPGGDKRVKTVSETTVLALEAAKRIVAPGGLISVVSYLGHSGGREEYEMVQSFAAGLPIDSWVDILEH